MPRPTLQPLVLTAALLFILGGCSQLKIDTLDTPSDKTSVMRVPIMQPALLLALDDRGFVLTITQVQVPSGGYYELAPRPGLGTLNWKVELNPDGSLKSVNGTSDQQIDEYLGTLASFIPTLSALAPPTRPTQPTHLLLLRQKPDGSTDYQTVWSTNPESLKTMIDAMEPAARPRC